MKTILITISLAVLITSISMISNNVWAKERKLCPAESCFLDTADASSNIIMGWMMNPNYFHQAEGETSEASIILEEWMLDIHHFNSPEFAENDQKSEAIESWMKSKGHFNLSFYKPIASRFQRLDNHMGNIKVVIAKR